MGLLIRRCSHGCAKKCTHRGPDEGENFTDGQFGIGFRRLKIIDLFTGNQPMSSEDGNLWLVCNGEIYNYKTLREELINKGHHFSSQSDSEVILHLYEEKGTECLQSLRGMFAFVLWDKKRQTLFGARDRFGIKPFYYMDKPGFLAFASEIKAFTELPHFPGK
jgi:asparagine synthase (glutamine-hydrolysing)